MYRLSVLSRPKSRQGDHLTVAFPPASVHYKNVLYKTRLVWWCPIVRKSALHISPLEANQQRSEPLPHNYTPSSLRAASRVFCSPLRICFAANIVLSHPHPTLLNGLPRTWARILRLWWSESREQGILKLLCPRLVGLKFLIAELDKDAHISFRDHRNQSTVRSLVANYVIED